MANYNFSSLKVEYAELWHNMDIKPNRLSVITAVADRIITHKEVYDKIQAITNVPWYFIGLVHLRESNLNFNTHLHNGDPLTARTKHVPAGYPRTGTPPFSFEYSAVDALKKQGLDKITDWGIERIAYHFEKYNGFGYRGKGVNSPYLWASTDNYIKGKYIADGVFNANVVDSQLGVMAVLKVILDKTATQPVVEREPTISPAAEAPRPTTQQMNKTSRKFYLLDWLKWITGIGGTATAGTQILDTAQITATKSYVDSLKSFGTEYGPLVVMIALIGAFVAFMIIQKWAKDDVQEGRNTPSGATEQ